jgi:AbrB family looped-hinge helix DNA binding protein
VLAKLSSKGQLIIPKGVRRSLALEPGAQFQIDVVEGRIILEPLSGSTPVDQLYGKYSGTDLLETLEDEHRLEVQEERDLCS